MILSIAPVLAKVILPPASPLIATFNIILSYSLTIIFRPLGSAIFGNLGDKIGRRADLIITVLGLGITSALTSALPTYAQAGILSFALFVLIRVAEAFSRVENTQLVIHLLWNGHHINGEGLLVD